MFKNNLPIKFINLLIIFFPLSLILGNLIVNLNILLIIFFGILIFKFEIFYINKRKLLYLIYIFFFYLIFITFLNNFNFEKLKFTDLDTFLKSLGYLRYLLLFLVIKELKERNYLNLKYFSFFSMFLVVFLSLDIVYQAIFGEDIFGLPIVQNRPSGFFGDEAIAGGYIQKFSIITILFLINKKKNFFLDNKLIFISLTVLFFFIAILLTNNRMPLILFTLTCLTYFFINKNYKIIFSILIICSLILLAFLNFNERARNGLSSFYHKTQEMIFVLPKLILDKNYKHNLKGSDYVFLFNGGIEVWKKNKIFGHGIKSFRKKCSINERELCASHPHNYHIEILVDTGIIGLFLIYLIFYFIVYKNFKIFISMNQDSKSKLNYVHLAFILVLIFEFFPLRSSGSFFSTSNASIIFLFLGFLYNLKKLKN